MKACGFLLVVWLFIHAESIHAQEDDAAPSFDVSKTASFFRPQQALFYRSNFDLGRLPLNAEGTVKLTVKNPTAEPFPFTKITKSSSFLSVASDKKVIPAGGTIELKMKLRTPEFPTREIFGGFVSLIDESDKDAKRKPPLNLDITCKMAGLVYIEPHTVSFEVPRAEDSAELRIPLLFTEPITIDRLEFKVDDSLKDLTFEFDNDGEEIVVSAFVPAEFVGDGTVNGEVTVFDSVSKREDTVFVTMRQEAKYKISPSLLRFNRTSNHVDAEEDSNLFVATVLIRRPEADKAVPDGDDATKKQLVGSDFQVGASIAGVACRVETQNLSSRIVKARIFCDLSQLPEAKAEDDATKKVVTWTIREAGEVAALNSQALFAQTHAEGVLIPKADIQQHASVYEAYLSNVMAWETGDFLVKVTRVDDSTERSGATGNIVFEVTELYRIRFDHTAKRYLCLSQRGFEVQLIDHPKVDLKKLKKKWLKQTGFSLLNGKLNFREPPRETRRSTWETDLPIVLKRFMIPEFRSAGLISQARGESMAHLHTIIPKLASGQGVTAASHTLTGNLKFLRRKPVPHSDQVFVTKVVLDTNSFMPVLKDSKIEVFSDGVRKLIPNFVERVTWQEIDGVFVPKSVSTTFKGSRRIGGVSFGVDKTADMEFRWLSLNVEMKDEDFDPVHLDDFDRLLQFDETMEEDVDKPGIFTKRSSDQ